MAEYKYQGRDSRGRNLKGTLQANSTAQAASKLLNKGITPIDIHEIKASQDILGLLKQKLNFNSIKPIELIMFCRQMRALIDAGMSLDVATEQLAQSATSELLQTTLQDVSESLRSGKSLVASMQQHTRVFPPIVISLIKAGEESGQLSAAFQQLVSYLERENTMVKKLKSIMRYPIIVISTIVIGLVVINIMVLPAFSKLFSSMKTELPVPTRILMFTSKVMTQHWGLLILFLAIIVVMIKLYLAKPSGRLVWDRYKLKLPVVGTIMHSTLLARFSWSFSMVMRTGIPIITGINLIADVIGNAYLKQQILSMGDDLERGENLLQSARNSGMFSSLIIQLFAVGEESGTLQSMFEEAAKYYEEQSDYGLSRMSDLMEPILLAIVSAMVTVLALGIFLPMWDIVKFAR